MIEEFIVLRIKIDVIHCLSLKTKERIFFKPIKKPTDPAVGQTIREFLLLKVGLSKRHPMLLENYSLVILPLKILI